jgi:hypothetical protein
MIVATTIKIKDMLQLILNRFRWILLSSFLMLPAILLSQSNTFSEAHYFLDLVNTSDVKYQEKAFSFIDQNWKPEYEIMALEVMYFVYNTEVGAKMALLLQRKTNQNFGLDFNAWYTYLWNKKEQILPDYAYFKSQLHKLIDPKFEYYFQGRQRNRTIRLDEIRWGGVVQDGIPPLRNPEMTGASNAKYLADDNIVFGIEVNGEARAYPKRILAWHEMFTDTIQGIPLAGVYCTLCGTVILYKTTANGVNHNLGTSGFLYRSNKLMYDQTTQSLWSTLEGKPVVGPLVDKGIQLDYLSVVTTTWGEWKRRHPNTKVLSLNTGHSRDYGEGVAYKNYFADDELMFNVPKVDKRLKNKQSILAIRVKEVPDETLAISSKFLQKNRIYHEIIGSKSIVVLTDKTGASRVYETNGTEFKRIRNNDYIEDNNDVLWTITESELRSEVGIRKRVQSFNAFWFGWQAVYPDTRLIK